MQPADEQKNNTTVLDGNDSIRITMAAINKIKSILENEPEGTIFRIRVDGGGCSGFSYNFLLDHRADITADDVWLMQSPVMVVSDTISIGMLQNAVVDHESDLSYEKFVILNPLATSTCGCGNSFGI